MSRQRWTRFLRGIGANLYGQLVVAAIQLAGVPILLHCWGPRIYGEWLIVFALPGYLSMTDLGFSLSAANDMTRLAAAGERGAARSVFQSLFVLLVGTGMVMLSLVVIALWLLPVSRFVHLGGLPAVEVKIVLICLAAEILIKLFDGLNHAGFRASGAYALHQTITSTTPLVQQSAVWAIAWLGGSPLLAAGAYMLVRAVMVPGTAWLLVSRYPWLVIGIREAQLLHLKRLLKPALGNLALPFGQALNIQGMVLVVGAMLGPLAVVAFSTMRTLTRLALQMVACISYAAEPEFAVMMGQGDAARMAEFFRRTMRFSLLIAVVTISALALLGSSILTLWTHGAVRPDPVLFDFLLATVLSQTLWNGALAMLKACNKHMRAAAGQLVAAFAALLLALALLGLTKNIAMAGIAVFLADAGFLVFVARQARRVFGLNMLVIAMSAFDPRVWIAELKRPLHA